MCTVSQMVCLAGLAGLSALDIYFRKIPVNLLILAGAAAAMYQFFVKKEDVCLVAGGMAVGVLFLVIGKVTQESIGYGDGWAVLILGIYLGFWKLLEVLAATCFLLAAASVICMVRRKMSRKAAIPFYPFLMAGYLMCLVC